jgi:hypothetical protein
MGMLLTKVFSKTAPLLIVVSHHLLFKKPFQLMFSIGGGFLAAAWGIIAFASHLQ